MYMPAPVGETPQQAGNEAGSNAIRQTFPEGLAHQTGGEAAPGKDIAALPDETLAAGVPGHQASLPAEPGRFAEAVTGKAGDRQIVAVRQSPPSGQTPNAGDSIVAGNNMAGGGTAPNKQLAVSDAGVFPVEAGRPMGIGKWEGTSEQKMSALPESGHFVETVTRKSESEQVAANVRQLCLKDQSHRIDDDIVAVINKASGKVMADQGKGFVTSPAGTFLKEGNRVITLEESEAEIVFFDCCRSTLKANNLVTINATPGCKAAVLNAAPASAAASLNPLYYVLPATGALVLYIRSISRE